MKSQAFITSAALAALVAVAGVGCAKNGGSGVALTPNGSTATGTNYGYNSGSTVSPVGAGVGQIAGQSGAAVAFKPDSLAIMNTYVATHPLNNPQNFALNVDLRDIGGNRYAGSIRIGYNDNGSWYQGQFESGYGTNQVSYNNIDEGKSEAEFNKWFTYQGKTVFHGFFQDKYGAVMLVIDKALDLGDGAPIGDVDGSVWFKNFTNTGAYQSPEKCWFIRIGPFDCRTFVIGSSSSGVINTTSALYPGNGYQRLGTFKGLDKLRAFNQ